MVDFTHDLYKKLSSLLAVHKPVSKRDTQNFEQCKEQLIVSKQYGECCAKCLPLHSRHIQYLRALDYTVDEKTGEVCDPNYQLYRSSPPEELN